MEEQVHELTFTSSLRFYRHIMHRLDYDMIRRTEHILSLASITVYGLGPQLGAAALDI